MPYAQQAEGILNLWYEFVKGEDRRKQMILALSGVFSSNSRLFVS